eukprot:IDg13030t1
MIALRLQLADSLENYSKRCCSLDTGLLGMPLTKQAFGDLVARLGILWRPLRFDVFRLPLILQVFAQSNRSRSACFCAGGTSLSLFALRRETFRVAEQMNQILAGKQYSSSRPLCKLGLLAVLHSSIFNIHQGFCCRLNRALYATCQCSRLLLIHRRRVFARSATGPQLTSPLVKCCSHARSQQPLLPSDNATCGLFRLFAGDIHQLLHRPGSVNGAAFAESDATGSMIGTWVDALADCWLLETMRTCGTLAGIDIGLRFQLRALVKSAGVEAC